MPWRTMDVHEQRVEFVVAAARKSKPFRSLCHEFGISRPTGYLWLRRYQRHGVQGIAERSRKPLASPRDVNDSKGWIHLSGKATYRDLRNSRTGASGRPA